jgi:hypothetical protein
VLGAQGTLTHGQQRGVLVPGGGRVSRRPGPVGEPSASAGVLGAQEPLAHGQQRGQQVPGGSRILSRSKTGSGCWPAVSSWRQAARLYSLISPFSMDFRRIRWTSRLTAVTPGASHP